MCIRDRPERAPCPTLLAIIVNTRLTAALVLKAEEGCIGNIRNFHPGQRSDVDGVGNLYRQGWERDKGGQKLGLQERRKRHSAHCPASLIPALYALRTVN